MYQKPKLNCVGQAQEVILGVIPTGCDVDTFFCDNEMAFADDGDADGDASHRS